MQFAKSTNQLLIRGKDGNLISPQQERHDAYAKQKQLKHHLALMQDDDSNSIDEEFETLMVARLPQPTRLMVLAAVLLERGRREPAERAIEKVIAEYPISTAAQSVAPLLSSLSKYELLDDLYEKLAASVGGRSRLPVEVRSTWAFMIAEWNADKSVKLSLEAHEARPSCSDVFENHLAILSEIDPTACVDFFQKSSWRPKSDIGYFAVGKAALRIGLDEQAEENLRTAHMLVPDPVTKAFLSEALFRLGRYSEAAECCSEGIAALEAYETNSFADFDGERRNPLHLYFKAKKSLRLAFLAVQSKILMALGEEASARERLEEVLNTRVDNATYKVFFDGLASVAGEYTTRGELEKNLAKERRRVVEVLSRLEMAEAKASRLDDVVLTIAQSQQHWKESLLKIRDAATQDALADRFSSEIHSLCRLLVNNDLARYESIRDDLARRFCFVPRRSIEQLANAHFLVVSHSEEHLPIFAGAVIEFGKAIESAINEIAIGTYLRFCYPGVTQKTVQITTKDGKVRYVELIHRGMPRKLSLGEISLFLTCRDSEWARFCRQTWGDLQTWIFEDLPRIVKVVKDEYRNFAAHDRSMDRDAAVRCEQFISRCSLLDRLNEMATSIAGLS